MIYEVYTTHVHYQETKQKREPSCIFKGVNETFLVTTVSQLFEIRLICYPN